MARIFDVVDYPNEMRDEIVHRFPEVGPGNFRVGTQVIVRESQTAVFFRDGNALDVFGPGRHTIVTYNIPLVIESIGKTLFNDATPFPAEVYYISMREFADKKWGSINIGLQAFLEKSRRNRKKVVGGQYADEFPFAAYRQASDILFPHYVECLERTSFRRD